MHLYMQPVQDITVDDRVSRTQYQYTLEDPDTDELNEWTTKFVAQLKKLPELEDVATDQQTGARAIQLAIDRVTASRLGIAPTTIDNTLYDAYGQREISTLYTQLNQYHVILETQPEWQRSQEAGDLYIQSNASSGATARARPHRFLFRFGIGRIERAHHFVRYTPSSQVVSAPATVLSRGHGARRRGARLQHSSAAGANAIPLSAFTQVTNITEALSINHQGQFPSVTVSFNLAPNASLGTAISDIDKVAKNLNFPASLAVRLPGHRCVVPEFALQRSRC
jgi:multidrug efflux pump